MTDRGRHRDLCRLQVQRLGRSHQRPLQNRVDPPPALEDHGNYVRGDPRMGVLVEPQMVTEDHGLHFDSTSTPYMRSFTFFFNADTFGSKRQLVRAGTSVPIDYVGFDDKRPCNTFAAGDELFIVGLSASQVLLAGRMVIAGPAEARADVSARTRRADYINKPLICLSDPAQLDYFRPDLKIPVDIAQGLELFTIGGEPTNTTSLRAGRPDPNLFRACPRLSEASAQQLRNLLGLSTDASKADSPDEGEAPEGLDDDEYRHQAKTRRGQRQFRQSLLDAYNHRCIITSCKVEALLEAAHITPHTDLTDYRVSNGLLLRADIHTLFDLDLITIDEFYRVKVSEQLRHSEYWIYNDRRLDRFPVKSSDQPNREALRARALRLKTAGV